MLDDIDRRTFHYIVFVLVHIRIVQAEEDAHILQIYITTVVDYHLHLIVVLADQPVGGWFDADIDERLFHQQLLEDTVHILLAVLHIAQQAIIDTLVASAVEVIENLLLALIKVSLLRIILGFQQVGTEHTIALHRGTIKAEQILTFTRFVEIGAVLIRIEQIRQGSRLTRIFHAGLIEVRHGFRFIPFLPINQAFQHQGRCTAVGIEFGIILQDGVCLCEMLVIWIVLRQ